VETIPFSDPAGRRIESEADFAALLETVERSGAVAARLNALKVVRDGVITGEGPTTAGRVHFSRTIDAADTALIRRILLAGGAQAVTRDEAEALFEIHHAACERTDGGAFDDLAVRTIAHHALAASGYRVPDRATGLASATPLAGRRLDPAVAAWLQQSLRRWRRHPDLLAALAALLGAAAPMPAKVAADLAA